MQSSALKITGMNSEQCADMIAARLSEISGVSDVKISLLHSRAIVELDERTVRPQQLISALEAIGFGGHIERKEEGSCCGGCCH